MNEIANENKKHHDMLVPNVEDNYHTVGLKLLSSFYWTTQLEKKYDLKWIIKIDDDMMVNFTKLDNYLTKENINYDALHCPINNGMPALRDANSKW